MPGFSKYRGAYSGDDISRYLKGEMPPEQMHALEKAALHDPFLAEALEGYAMAMDSEGEENIHKDLQSLKAAIDKRSSPSNIKPISGYRWIKVAAAAAVIIAAGIFTYTSLLPSRKESVLAGKQTRSMKETPSAAPDELKKNVDAEAARSPSPVSSTLPSDNESVLARKQNRPAGETPSPALDERKINPDSKVARAESSAAVTLPSPPPKSEELPEPVSLSKKETPGASDNALSGIRKKKMETLSEKQAASEQEDKGLARTDDSVIVQGYGVARSQNDEDNTARAGRTAGIQEKAGIPSPSAKDSPVSGELSGRIAGADIGQGAIPEPGWAAFQEYIRVNKKMNPDDTQQNGQVTLSFRVRSKGRPENITVEQSLSPYYDKEATRLLSEGPSWKLLKGRKAKLSVSIHF